MSDREKVINDLQIQIEELEERLAIVLEGKPEIVRCKDCQFYNEGRNDVDAWMRCRLHSMNTSPDEFCSWAVKKN